MYLKINLKNARVSVTEKIELRFLRVLKADNLKP